MGPVRDFLRDSITSPAAVEGSAVSLLSSLVKRIQLPGQLTALAQRSIKWIKDAPLRILFIAGILALFFLFYRKYMSASPKDGQEAEDELSADRGTAGAFGTPSTLYQAVSVTEAKEEVEKAASLSPYELARETLLSTQLYKHHAQELNISLSGCPPLRDLQRVLVAILDCGKFGDAEAALSEFLPLFVKEHLERAVLQQDFLTSYWTRYGEDFWRLEDGAREAVSSVALLLNNLEWGNAFWELKPVRQGLKEKSLFLGLDEAKFKAVKGSPYQVFTILLSFLEMDLEKLFAVLLALEVNLQELYLKQPKLAKDILSPALIDLYLKTKKPDIKRTLEGVKIPDQNNLCFTEGTKERAKASIETLQTLKSSSEDAVVTAAIHIKLCALVAALLECKGGERDDFLTQFIENTPASELLSLKEEFWGEGERGFALFYGLLKQEDAYIFKGLKCEVNCCRGDWFKETLLAYFKRLDVGFIQRISQNEKLKLLDWIWGLARWVIPFEGAVNVPKAEKAFEAAVHFGLQMDLTFNRIALKADYFKSVAECREELKHKATLIADMRTKDDYKEYDRAVSLLKSDVSQARLCFEKLKTSSLPFVKKAAEMQAAKIMKETRADFTASL